MSAFQQSETHIGALIRWASQEADRGRWPATYGGPASPEAAFRMLAEANVASLQARYPGDDSVPVTMDRDLYDYPLLTLAEFFQALSGYEYQACEADGWERSTARRWCEAMRAAAIRRVPGVSEAETWAIGEGFGADRGRGPVPLFRRG